MNPVKEGQRKLIAIVVVLLLIEIVTIILTASAHITNGEPGKVPSGLFQGIVRLGLEAVILYFVYKGYKWAKWLMTALLLLSGAGSILLLTNAITVILGIMYLVIGAALLFSKTVNGFLQYQRR